MKVRRSCTCLTLARVTVQIGLLPRRNGLKSFTKTIRIGKKGERVFRLLSTTIRRLPLNKWIRYTSGGLYQNEPTNGSTLVVIGGNAVSATGLKYYADATAAAAFDFTSWENDFWNVNGEVAYPKCLAVPAVTLNGVEATTDVNTTITVETEATTTLSLNQEALDAGIMLDGNVITIPDDAALLGTNFTLTATSIYDSSKTVVKTVDICSITTTSLTSLGDVDMASTTALTVNVGEASGDLSVKLGDKVVDATYADGDVSIPVAQATDWGEKEIEIVFTQMNGETLASQKTFTTDAVLVTMSISKESEWNTLYNKVEAMQGNGYYVQTGDITFSGTSYNFGDSANSTYHGLGTGTNTFKGTYNGRGFKLENVSVMRYQSGLFKANGATIKNVVVLNADTTEDTAGDPNGILSVADTLVQNVYIEVANQKTLVFGRVNNVGTSNYDNVMVIVKAYTKHVLTENYGASTPAEYVQIGGVNTWSEGGSVHTGYTYYADATAAAAHDFSSWDTSFWTVVNGVATPNCLVS